MEPVLLGHHVGPDDSPEQAQQDLFGLVLAAQHDVPDAPRWLQLTIDDCYLLPVAGDHQPTDWEPAMLVLQMHFVLELLGPYLTRVEMPIGSFEKDEQRNDPPGSLEQLLAVAA